MKTPKVKKRGVSLHSRAARRQASPSLDVDKSLTSLKAPAEPSDHKPKILGVQNAGISKRKKGKAMSRQQRLRQQKGVERAERNDDRLEIKIAKSLVKNKRVKDRSADWEELNEKITQPIKQTTVDKGTTSRKAVEDPRVSADGPELAQHPSVPADSPQVDQDVDEIL